MASSVLLALVPVVGVGVGVEPRGLIWGGVGTLLGPEGSAGRTCVWWVAFLEMDHCFFEPVPVGRTRLVGVRRRLVVGPVVV
jgi:hypothetical protein